jgi:hypothetical protein
MKYTLKNKNIELTDEELDELNAQRDEKTERFVPTKEDNYWFVQSNGMVNIMTWINSNTDNYRLSQGNVFRTKEEAEAKLTYDEAVGTIREYILEQNGDWMPSSNENKYYLCHDNPISPGEWFSTWEYHNYSGAIGAYAESKQIINDTIEKYPEELEIIREFVINHNV